ncbi:glutamic acid-rich protein [Fagus crenata]
METLRAAFGISTSELNEQNNEGSDDVRNGQNDGLSDDIKNYEKREHAFLDREFRGKKNLDEDQKVVKDLKSQST